MPNLADLQRQCQALGLSVPPATKFAKEPYVQALRAHFLKRDYPNGLPYEELSPMLAFPYWDLSEKERAGIWKDGNNWAAQQKFNGCRLILHFVKDRGIYAHGRTVNKSDFRRTELSEHLVFYDEIPNFTATMDCEAIKTDLVTTSALFHMRPEQARRIQREHKLPLRFHVFDLVRWQDTDLREKRLCDRLSYLADFRTGIEAADLSQHFGFPALRFQDKRAFYEEILRAGGEGVVLKRLESKYIDSSTRDRTAWVKVKRQIEFDAYVSGFQQGRPSSKWSDHVACLHLSVSTDQGPVLIAKVSNIPWEYRKKITQYDRATGKVSLDSSVYGKCAKVAGQELSKKARRLVHPCIAHWRPELQQTHCYYRFADIESLRLGKAVVSPLRVTGSIR